MVKSLSIILFVLIGTTVLLSQENQVAAKQTELGKIRDEINSLQKEINLKTAKEKKTFEVVENYSRQGFLLNRLISQFREEEKLKQIEIDKSRKEIAALESEIKRLKQNYAKYVTAVYKRGNVPEWAAVIDANSLKQAVLRVEYLRRFSSEREKDLVKLKDSRTKLIAAEEKLEIEKKEKSRLASAKQSEEKSLSLKINERKQILNALKKDKSELRKELAAKKNAEQGIKNIIARLVAEAEQKRKEEAERLAALKKEKKPIVSETGTTIVKEITPAGFDVDLSTTAFSSFAAAKGKLNWPINGGKIISKYGENRNKQLNTITVNNGVDIKAGADPGVKVVAEGVVSAVDWIPGYGTVIIVTHKGDYRTVYGHLSEIYIKEGDKLKAGALIAKAAESTEGHILHFEVWNSRTNQNPEIWLSKK
jgi:murein hydrolase activator